MDFQSYQKWLSTIRTVLEDWQSSIEQEQELQKEEDDLASNLPVYSSEDQHNTDRRDFQVRKHQWQTQRNKLPNDRQITQEMKALCEPFITAYNAGRVPSDEAISHSYNGKGFWLTDPYNSEDLPRNERLDEIEVALQLIKSLYETSHKFRRVFDLPALDEGPGE